MTDNQEVNKQPKKKTSHLFLLLCLALIVAAFGVAKFSLDEKKYQLAKKSSATDQFSNIQSEIYNKESEQSKTVALEDENAAAQIASNSEISKGVYENLVKQQLQIDVLQEKYNALKSEVEKIKNQDKLSKIIINFVEVKDCIDARQNCDDGLQKLELLAKSDINLSSKIEGLRAVLQNKPKSLNQIKSEFTALIPGIMAAKPALISQSYLDKIRYQISKLFVIRRIDGVVGKTSQNIDFVIVETEKLIAENKYQQALDLLAAQDEVYKKILGEFTANLQNINQLNKITDEIFSYLKSQQNL